MSNPSTSAAVARAVAVRGLCVAVLLFGTGAGVGAGFAANRTTKPAASDLAGAPSDAPPPVPPAASALPAAPALPVASALPAAPAPRTAGAPLVVPRSGPGTFVAASTASAVRGTAGRLHRYRVAVEDGTGIDAAGFAEAVDAVLGDSRSWSADGTVRLQRVPNGQPADFTVLLATPATSETMCATGGLRTRGYSSCRLPGKVVINLARWLTAVPHYGAPLAEYRNYLINHEVGHQLGHAHEVCPGPGRPAPVMQQQTYRLDGCVAYGWPYRDGRRYRGAPTG